MPLQFLFDLAVPWVAYGKFLVVPDVDTLDISPLRETIIILEAVQEHS